MTGGITLWKDRGYEVDIPRSLNPEQRERYSRHLLIPEIGAEGQQKLLDAKVLLLGAGGLGSPTALYLAAAGIGTLGIVDDDVVDLSNLQRQVIHDTDGIGIPKVESAEQTIHALNPDVKVVKYQTRIDASNIMEIIEGYDVIVDGVDNFPTRYLLNDATVRLQIPVVSASILGFDGQLSVFKPYDGPCYRCLFREPPPAELAPSCGANGVLGVLPGTMGLLQATEVVKLILEIGEPAIGRLLLYDALGATLTEVKVHRDPECPICSREPDEIADEEMGVFPDYEAFCAQLGSGRASLAAIIRHGHDQDTPSPAQLRRRREGSRPTAATSARCSVTSRSPSCHPGPAVLRRRRAQPLRQRLPQRRGRACARRAGHLRRRCRHAGDPAGDGRRGLRPSPRVPWSVVTCECPVARSIRTFPVRWRVYASRPGLTLNLSVCQLPND